MHLISFHISYSLIALTLRLWTPLINQFVFQFWFLLGHFKSHHNSNCLLSRWRWPYFERQRTCNSCLLHGTVRNSIYCRSSWRLLKVQRGLIFYFVHRLIHLIQFWTRGLFPDLMRSWHNHCQRLWRCLWLLLGLRLSSTHLVLAGSQCWIS